MLGEGNRYRGMLLLTQEASLADFPGSPLFLPVYSTPVPGSPAESARKREREREREGQNDTQERETCYAFSEILEIMELLYVVFSGLQ